MASFSYIDPTFFLDSSNFFPNIKISSGSLEEVDINTTTYFSSYCPSQEPHHQEIDAIRFHDDIINTSSVENSTISSLPSDDNEPCLTEVNQQNKTNKSDNKRKKITSKEQGSSSCLISGQSKEIIKPKKQKKYKGKTKETEVKKSKVDHMEQQEPPSGYIHVRARRGQATDSHSLAERVRREKISERMKLLQSLVPGCDKVTGKALMLDEIINYVQSLKTQVEFLSLKLSSMNPVFYDFAVDLDTFMVKPEEHMSSLLNSPTQQQLTDLTTSSTSFTTRNNYPFLQIQQEQTPNTFSQVDANLLVGMNDEFRQRNSSNMNQSGFNPYYSSFQQIL